MSWGDLNGDGRSDYVDQKIFDTQINPYSGEYQGNQSTGGGAGNGAGVISLIIFGFIALVFFVAFPPFGIAAVIFGLFIYFKIKTAPAPKPQTQNLAHSEPTVKWVCPKCGELNGEYLLKCKCGEFRSAKAERRRVAESIPPTFPNSISSKVFDSQSLAEWKCPHCGEVNSKYSTICSCGERKT